MKYIKPVYQFDLEGNLIKEYSSVVAASLDLDINHSKIHNSVYSKNVCDKRFYFGRSEKFILEKRKRGCGKVYQFDLEGNLIKEYSSIVAASLDLDINHSKIHGSVYSKNVCDKRFYFGRSKTFIQRRKKYSIKYNFKGTEAKLTALKDMVNSGERYTDFLDHSIKFQLQLFNSACEYYGSNENIKVSEPDPHKPYNPHSPHSPSGYFFNTASGCWSSSDEQYFRITIGSYRIDYCERKLFLLMNELGIVFTYENGWFSTNQNIINIDVPRLINERYDRRTLDGFNSIKIKLTPVKPVEPVPAKTAFSIAMDQKNKLVSIKINGLKSINVSLDLYNFMRELVCYFDNNYNEGHFTFTRESLINIEFVPEKIAKKFAHNRITEFINIRNTCIENPVRLNDVPKSKPKPEPPTELIKIKPIDIYSRRVPRELYNLINELFHPGYWRSEFTRESLININIIPEKIAKRYSNNTVTEFVNLRNTCISATVTIKINGLKSIDISPELYNLMNEVVYYNFDNDEYCKQFIKESLIDLKIIPEKIAKKFSNNTISEFIKLRNTCKLIPEISSTVYINLGDNDYLKVSRSVYNLTKEVNFFYNTSDLKLIAYKNIPKKIRDRYDNDTIKEFVKIHNNIKEFKEFKIKFDKVLK